MATEEFSFPIITNGYPCSIDSPPLWHASPAASPCSLHEETSKEGSKGEENDGDQQEEEEEEEEEEEDHDDDCFARKPIESKQRKSCSSVEKDTKLVKIYGSEDDEEEKMDMLWEDFNIGELSRSYSSRLDSKRSTGLRMSKTKSAMISSRRPGIMAFMKVLKKLFLLHTYHPTVRKRPW